MLSRVADTIYWMNRYLERAENMTRFLDVHMNLLLDLPPDIEAPWVSLLTGTGDVAHFYEIYPEITRNNVIRFLLVDSLNPNAILSCLGFARENARVVRERISTEMWSQINHLYLMSNTVKNKLEWTFEELFLFLEQIRLGCYCIAGLAHHTLSRSEDWHVAKLGRHLERADQLTRILNVNYDSLMTQSQSTTTTLDLIQWGAVLRSVSGYEMYRRESGILSPQKIASFLILNPDFPRSLSHNIIRLQEAFHALAGTQIGNFYSLPEKKIGKLRAEIEYADTQDIFKEDIHIYLDKMQDQLYDIGNEIYDYFYSGKNGADIK